MLSRRELMTIGVAGGLGVPTEAATVSAPENQQPDRAGLQNIADSVGSLESAFRSAFLANSLAHGTVAKIRPILENFFRTNNKFPDFIDIGVSVFMDLYDWHVKNGQQLMVTRAPDGRYWMQFMFTTMILRQEVDPNYVGLPYDK